MITQLNANQIEISPQNITVSRAALAEAVHYLRAHNHYAQNPCQIRSNNTPRLSGPLCSASRGVNANVRCINYILPLLSAADVVGISGQRPNTTWLL